MFKKRVGERRINESSAPNGCLERRLLAERRNMSVAEATFEEFEILMSAHGFRPEEAVEDKKPNSGEFSLDLD